MLIKKRYISWEEVIKLSTFIANQIKEKREDKSIKYILAVAKGGVIPAILIASRLSNTSNFNTLIIKAIHYEDEVKATEKVYIDRPLLEDIKNKVEECRRENKVVFIIDDIADTGMTLKSLINNIGSNGVKTATLYLKPKSILKPDYYGEECKNEEWIVFPWEVVTC